MKDDFTLKLLTNLPGNYETTPYWNLDLLTDLQFSFCDSFRGKRQLTMPTTFIKFNCV